MRMPEERRQRVVDLPAESGASPHQSPAATATATTTGTKTLLTRSPRRWMSARLVWARCTAAMMCASAVASPVAVTRMTSRPFKFTVPAKSSLPDFLSAGNGFAGEHGLVHGGIAFDHHAVHRHAVAGSQRDQVADFQFGDGNFDFLPGTVADGCRAFGPVGDIRLSRGLRREIQQDFKAPRRAGAHAGFQPVPVLMSVMMAAASMK